MDVNNRIVLRTNVVYHVRGPEKYVEDPLRYIAEITERKGIELVGIHSDGAKIDPTTFNGQDSIDVNYSLDGCLIINPTDTRHVRVAGFDTDVKEMLGALEITLEDLQ